MIEVKIVKQMPAQAAGKKPTIAVITSRYYEKLAIDAMMEDKTTFVKYKTEGESNVYTIGFIGPHKVVSTKLPAVGRQMAAQISSGNTTTRLLGTFNDVEHVLLVGVCGGVPHYTDFYSHTRLGDLVISAPNGRGQVFVYCEKVTEDTAHGRLQYSLKSWTPGSQQLLDTARALVDQASADGGHLPWEEYAAAGAQLLTDQEVTFDRPSADTDRLFMNVGGDDMIEVAHPPVPPDAPPLRPDCPTVRFGALASGKPIAMGDQMRLEFAARHQCIGVDTEFDQVLESIVGNRQDSFLFVRGVADYMDGSKNAEWQPYAALLAAAFTKTLLEQLPAK